MAGAAAMLSMALYIAPYFDKNEKTLQPELVILYITSAFHVAGTVAFLSPSWLEQSGGQSEITDPRSVSFKGRNSSITYYLD